MPMEIYEIRVNGHLATGWTEWLGHMTVEHLPGGETMLCGSLPDQAALRSVLNRLWDLNMEVKSVTQQKI